MIFLRRISIWKNFRASNFIYF